jgi:RecB family exonuclease
MSELLERWVVNLAGRPGRPDETACGAASLLREDDPRRLHAVIDGAAQIRRREGIDPPDVFDGVLSDPAVRRLLSAKFSDRYVFSASQFDAYAACPFAYFLRYVVGLEPPVAPPERVEPVDAGSICHDVLAALHRQAAEAGRTVWDNLEETESLLSQELRTMFDARRRQELGLTERRAEVYRRELQEVLSQVIADHPEEEAFKGLRPRHFELSFGFSGTEGNAGPAARPLRLELDGESVLVRGRIDRVDVDGESPPTYGVLDYKTGSTPGASEIRRGLNTQLALYVAACREVFFPDGCCSVAGFLSLYRSEMAQPIRRSPSGKRTRTLTPDYALRCLRQYVQAYVSAMRRGLFPPAPSSEHTCSYCNFVACCRPERSRIERKLGEGGRNSFLGIGPPPEADEP